MIEDSRRIIQDMVNEAYKEGFDRGMNAVIETLKVLCMEAGKKRRNEDRNFFFPETTCLKAVNMAKKRAFVLYGAAPTIEVGFMGQSNDTVN